MFTIEKNVPLPDATKPAAGRPTIYPWDKMQPGDSFAFPREQAASIRSCARKYLQTHPMCGLRFTSRLEGKQVRIWALANSGKPTPPEATFKPYVTPDGMISFAAPRVTSRRKKEKRCLWAFLNPGDNVFIANGNERQISSKTSQYSKSHPSQGVTFSVRSEKGGVRVYCLPVSQETP